MKLNFSKTITVFTTLVLLLSLEGCTNIVAKMPEELLRFRKETAKNGLLIGSITFPKLKAGHNCYFLNVTFESPDQKTAKKNFIQIQINPNDAGFHSEHNGQIDGGLTYLFAVERPEGDYSISSIRLLNNVTSVVTFNQYAKDFYIPFKIKKGEITYIGNIQYDEHKEKGSEGYAVNLKNNFVKDVVAIKRIQPLTDWRMVVDRKEYTITHQQTVLKE